MAWSVRGRRADLRTDSLSSRETRPASFRPAARPTPGPTARPASSACCHLVAAPPLSLSLSRNTLPRRVAPDVADVPLVAEFVAGECPALPSVQLGPRPWASALSWAASHFSGLIFS